MPVRVGLGFHSARLVLYLLLLLVLIGGFLLSMALDDPKANEPPTVLAATLLVATGLMVLAPLSGLVGSVLCLAVPAAANARGVLAASLLLELAALGGSLVVAAVDAAGLLPDHEAPLFRVVGVVLTSAVGLASWVLFMVFLTRLGRYLGADGAVFDAGNGLRQGVLLLPALLPAAAALVAGLWWLAGPKWAGVIGAWVLFGWLFLFVRWTVAFLGVLGDLRRAAR
jgi:hypothetical protein